MAGKDDVINLPTAPADKVRAMIRALTTKKTCMMCGDDVAITVVRTSLTSVVKALFKTRKSTSVDFTIYGACPSCPHRRSYGHIVVPGSRKAEDIKFHSCGTSGFHPSAIDQ